MKEDKDVSFINSIHPFSLFFKDKKYEEGFRKTMDSGRYYSAVYRYSAYPIMVVVVVYRFLGLSSAYSNNFVENAGQGVELFMAIIQYVSLLIELAIKTSGKFKILSGLFFVSSLKLIIYMAAFTTNGIPMLGMTSMSSVIALFPLSMIFSSTWLTMAASGIPASIYIVLAYNQVFSKMGMNISNNDKLLICIAYMHAIQNHFNIVLFLHPGN